MKSNFSQEELLFLKKDEVSKFKGTNVIIKKIDNTEISSQIINIIGASNEPHLPCGFVLNNNADIYFGTIKEIIL